MRLLRHEFIEIAARPLLWIGTMAFSVFVLHAVGHLGVDEDKVVLGFYQTQADTAEMVETFDTAQALMQEMANIEVLAPKLVTTDIATQILRDNIDIAITRTADGWRFTLRSRSAFEHRRLVRVAQVLGASIRQRKPWFIIAYDAIRGTDESEGLADGWPSKIQISGVTADPGRHARTFVPKTIALLAFFVAFAYASRSMIRDISNNTLSTVLIASRSCWLCLIAAKTLTSVMMGLVVLWTLLLFASYSQEFQIKDGLYLSSAVQLVGLFVSGLLGIALSLFARTESRIYFIGSAYLVLLVLLSGLISKIDPAEKVLFWISSVLPLGYAMDILSDWMFFGLVPVIGNNPTQILVALLILSILTTFGAVLYYKRTL